MAYIMRFAADNVRQVVIKDSGHWLVEEQPNATVAAIVDFLSADSAITRRTLDIGEIDVLVRSGGGCRDIGREWHSNNCAIRRSCQGRPLCHRAQDTGAYSNRGAYPPR